jgi:uncharacterized membrane protein/polyisoprenoid-binding protein YceI
MKINSLLSIVIATFFLGCNYTIKKNSKADPDGNNNTQSNSRSYLGVKSIFQNKCLNCHSAATGNKGDINLESYQDIFAHKDVIISEIEEGAMPNLQDPKGIALTSEEHDTLLTWLKAGAPETETTTPADKPTTPPPPVTEDPPPTTTPDTDITPPPPETPPVELTYVGLKSIIDNKCATCHSEARGNKGRVNLETYQNVFSKKDLMATEIEDGAMPPLRGTPLTKEEHDLLLKWLKAGAPETLTPPSSAPPPPVTSPSDPQPNPLPPVTPDPLPQPLPPEKPIDSVAATPDLFSYDQVKSIFQNNCIACHSEKSGNPGGVNLETYENILTKKDLILSEITTNSMPPVFAKQKLSKEDSDLLKAWIQAGAPEKPAATSDEPPTTNPALQKISKLFFEKWTLVLNFAFSKLSVALAAPPVVKTTSTYSPSTNKITFEAVGKPALLKIKGEGPSATGSLNIDGIKASGRFDVELDKFTTGIELRDHHMKEKYLNTKDFPKAHVEIESVKIPDGWKAGQDLNDVEFKGALSLKGITKPITGKVTVKSETLKTEAQFTVSLNDFSIGVPKYLGITVADTVTIRVDIPSFIKSAP